MIMKTLTINGQTFIVVDADAMKKIADSDLDMNGRIIRNVLNGNEDTDAATVGQLNAGLDKEFSKLERNYELIETITLTEETSIIERSQEPDGTPYNFKDVLVVVSRGDTTISAQWLLWKVWYGEQTMEIFKNVIIGGSVVTNIKSQTDGNLRYLLFGESNSNTGHAASAYLENIQFLLTNDNINKMTLQHQTAMPIGTKFTIYAIRGQVG